MAMAMHAVAIRPLIDKVSASGALQVWFADDSAGGGKIKAVRQWWELLQQHGESYGYFVNPGKTWLLVKPEMLSEATTTFSDTTVNVTTHGVRHLGAPLCSTTRSSS